jgi:hypothetical protein
MALALIGLAFAAAACGPAASPSPVASLIPTTSAGASLPASPVEGVIVSVDSSSLSDVRGFTLRTSGGRTIDFRLGTLENPTEFPPGHLKEHQATSEAIRVFFRIEAGLPVVYRLADAAGD